MSHTFTYRWLTAAVVLAAALATGTGNARARELDGIEVAKAMEEVLVEVIGRAERSVVAIARVRRELPEEGVEFEFRPEAFGRQFVRPGAPQPTDPDFIPNAFATGVVVDRRGLILTACHVLGERSDYYVTTVEGKVYRATVKGADPRGDLAVLAVEATDLVPITLGDASKLKKGRIVVALGNPHAIARDGRPSAAWGIVANLARKAPPVPRPFDRSGKTTLHHFGTLIQTDAKLNLGTSGGPLLNLRGEMVGMLTSLPAATGYEEAAGYAIPVDRTFRRAVELLKQGREVEYGLLGVQLENPRLEEVLRGVRGARVDRVIPGTPALRDGLKPGDLITAVDGVPIRDADALRLEVGRLPVETTVQLSILRDERQRRFDVTLAKLRVADGKIVTTPSPAWRGMRIDYPTAVIDLNRLEPLEATLPDGGVIVTEVEQNTPAWAAGLRAEMLVTHVGRRAVRTPNQFRAAIAGKTGPVRLRMAADKENPTRTVPPEW
jgi:S1-C subfamily serine protease